MSNNVPDERQKHRRGSRKPPSGLHSSLRLNYSKIKQLINENGLKHYHIARKILNIHPTLFAKKLKGERPFLPEELMALANLLRTDLTSFY